MRNGGQHGWAGASRLGDRLSERGSGPLEGEEEENKRDRSTVRDQPSGRSSGAAMRFSQSTRSKSEIETGDRRNVTFTTGQGDERVVEVQLTRGSPHYLQRRGVERRHVGQNPGQVLGGHTVVQPIDQRRNLGSAVLFPQAPDCSADRFHSHTVEVDGRDAWLLWNTPSLPGARRPACKPVVTRYPR